MPMSPFLDLPLTTVALNIEGAAERMARRVARILADQPPLLGIGAQPIHVIERGSVAAPQRQPHASQNS